MWWVRAKNEKSGAGASARVPIFPRVNYTQGIYKIFMALNDYEK